MIAPQAAPRSAPRSAARLAAVQALYQMDVTGAGARDIIKEFELYRLRQDVEGEELRAIDLQWFEAIVAGVVQNQREIDSACSSMAA